MARKIFKDIFKERTTRVVFLLDETGSMGSVVDKTIEGFNNYLKELKVDRGDSVLFTFRKFDSNGIKNVCTDVPISMVPLLSKETYKPGAMTNLYDAIGRTIEEAGTLKEAETTIFVILTDGYENCSVYYTHDAVKSLIDSKNWTFVFLGAGIDAMKIGTGLGINAGSTFSYDPANTVEAYSMVGAATASLRSSGGNTKKFFRQ